MKKFLAAVLLITLFFDGIAFTVDFDMGFKDSVPKEALDFCNYSECSNVLLFSAEEAPQALEYSRLNGVLTVEVGNVSAAEGYSLVVVEYNADDLPIDVHIKNDIEGKNVISLGDGAYEKAFLWDIAEMRPACPEISTRTDYEIVEGTDGDWSVSPDGHMLYSYLGSEADVIIPNSYRGKLITSIFNQPAANTYKEINKEINLFGGRDDITSFVIPEGIMRIGPCAFYGCKASCGLNLPSTLIYIGNYAFTNCVNLTGSVDLSAVTNFQSYGYQFCNCKNLDGTLDLPSVDVIPKFAFYGCEKLTGGINIPNGVKRIDEYAFSCTSGASFTALTLPGSLERIEKGAFQFQTRIQNEIILPEGLKHIGDAAFNHCVYIPNTVLTIPKSLESIGGDNGDENTGYGGHVFYDAFKHVNRFEVASGSSFFKAEDGVLYSKNGTRLLAYPCAKTDSSFTIPEGVTQIDEMALGQSSFSTLVLPDSYVISETVPSNIVNNKANSLAAAIYHYNNLQAVEVKPTNLNYISVNGIVYSKDKTELWYVPPKVTGAVMIEDGCEKIKSGACWMENNNYTGELYTAIYIPKTVSEINDNTLNDLNRKVYNGFTIYLDTENESFEIQDGKIVKIGLFKNQNF